MNVLTKAASVIFVLCIPVLLVTTAVRLAANEERLYEYGFNKFEVSEATGLSDAELRDFTDQLIIYFNSDAEFLDTEVFTGRELVHMKDVKGLIQLAYVFQLAALIFVALFIVGNVALRRRAFGRMLGRHLIWASGLTVGLLALFGFWAAADFDSLFLLFHLVGFSNDLWQANPGDNMLLMFPPEFFNDAALFVAAAIIGAAVVIGGISWVALRLGRRPDGEVMPAVPETGKDARVDA